MLNRSVGQRRPQPAAMLALCVVWLIALGSPLGRVDGMSAQGARSVWDGVYSEAQAERGAVLYQAGCSECHGAGLEGGEMEPPLTGSEFMYAWNGLSVGDLFERVRISMPPANPDSVSRQSKADILAYLLSVNGVPPGDIELSRRTADLRAISIDAVQP